MPINSNVAGSIPNIWSALILESLKKNLAFEPLVNTDYEGDIARVGDTVTITSPGAVTIGDYTGTITYEEAATSNQTLVINNDKYFAFKVDDLDELQTRIDLMSGWAVEASYGLVDAWDLSVAAEYVNLTGSTPLDISTDNTGVRAALIAAGVDLSSRNVPTSGRWMVVSPLVGGAIRDVYGGRETEGGDMVAREGFIARAEGFDIFESNNITVLTTPDRHACMYGVNRAISSATQINDIEPVRLLDSFSDALRGRLVWGIKTIDPAAGGTLMTTI